MTTKKPRKPSPTRGGRRYGLGRDEPPSERMTFTLTIADKNTLITQAASRGLSVSSFLRKLIRGEARPA